MVYLYEVVGLIVVNQIVYYLNVWLEQDVVMCVKYKVLIFIILLCVLVKEILDVVYSYGGIVLYDVINLCYVEKVLEVGVDGLILVVVGVGGYVGMLLFFVLVGEVWCIFDGLIVLLGVIVMGDVILVVQVMGVDFVYIGMCFIVSQEVYVVESYK